MSEHHHRSPSLSSQAPLEIASQKALQKLVRDDVALPSNQRVRNQHKMTLVQIHEQRKIDQQTNEMNERDRKIRRIHCGESQVVGDKDIVDPELDAILALEPESLIEQEEEEIEEHEQSIDINVDQGGGGERIEPLTKQEKQHLEESRRRKQQQHRLFRWRWIGSLNIHRFHLRMLLVRSIQRSRLCNDQELRASLLSLFPDEHSVVVASLRSVHNLVSWFTQSLTSSWTRTTSSSSSSSSTCFSDLWSVCKYSFDCMRRQLLHLAQNTDNQMISIGRTPLCFLFVAFCRSINVPVRLICSLSPLPHQPGKLVRRFQASAGSLLRQPNDPFPPRCPCQNLSSLPTSSHQTSKKRTSASKRRRSPKIMKKKASNEKLDDSLISIEYWSEMFVESEKRWIPIDVLTESIDERRKYSSKANDVAYVIAIDPASSRIVDVTRRYTHKCCNLFKRRCDEDIWEAELDSFKVDVDEAEEARDIADAQEMNDIADSEEMPTSVEAYRSHSKYCIEKFAKKYEAVYPKEPVLGTVGKGKNQYLIYPRANLHTLHTEDRWIRECRIVRKGEPPFKVVKPSALTTSGEEQTSLFGRWQTDVWRPQAARNGIVPKNVHGRVALWSERHLPLGCVHIKKRYRIGALAKRLGIDFAYAFVGFQMAGRRSVPEYDGIVVCEEFKDVLLDAWQQAEQKRIETAEKRRMSRIIERWRAIVRGTIVRHRIHETHSHVLQMHDKNAKRTSTNQNQDTTKRSSTISFTEPAAHEHRFPDYLRIFDEQNHVWKTKCAECEFEIEEEEL